MAPGATNNADAARKDETAFFIQSSSKSLITVFYQICRNCVESPEIA
jgi:hypothetical protein